MVEVGAKDMIDWATATTLPRSRKDCITLPRYDGKADWELFFVHNLS